MSIEPPSGPSGVQKSTPAWAGQAAAAAAAAAKAIARASGRAGRRAGRGNGLAGWRMGRSPESIEYLCFSLTLARPLVKDSHPEELERLRSLGYIQ